MKLKHDYTIGDVKFSFGSWAQKTYCEKIGIDLDDLYKSLSDGTAFKAKNIPVLLLTAAEAYTYFNDLDVKHSEKDAYLWIDEMGGLNSSKMLDFLREFAVCAYPILKDKLEVLMQDEKNAVRQEVESV